MGSQRVGHSLSDFHFQLQKHVKSFSSGRKRWQWVRHQLQMNEMKRFIKGNFYDLLVQYSCLENPMDGGAWKGGRWESDTTERLHFHFSLSCIGEGNGNPLQCSCLENPRDRGAWWAAIYGVTQSQTQLKWLSSSSSMYLSRLLLSMFKNKTWIMLFLLKIFFFHIYKPTLLMYNIHINIIKDSLFQCTVQWDLTIMYT